MKVLFLSPHLDDAVFSAGGYIAALVGSGYEVEIVTYFTKSVLHPTGFALACQLDKNLGPEVDYMTLRREEDVAAGKELGASVRHLDLAEAPHRGYHSAEELFAGVHELDNLDQDIDALSTTLLQDDAVVAVFAPIGIGNHADHLQVRAAVERLYPMFPEKEFFFWYDQPYLVNRPEEKPDCEHSGTDCTDLLEDLPPRKFSFDTSTHFERKMHACDCYTTQVPFQFKDSAGMRERFGQMPEEFFWRLI